MIAIHVLSLQKARSDQRPSRRFDDAPRHGQSRPQFDQSRRFDGAPRHGQSRPQFDQSRRFDDASRHGPSRSKSDQRSQWKSGAQTHKSDDRGNRFQKKSDYQSHKFGGVKSQQPMDRTHGFAANKASENIDGVQVSYQPKPQQINHGSGQKRSFKQDGNRWQGQSDNRRSGSRDFDGNRRQRAYGGKDSSPQQGFKKRGQFKPGASKNASSAAARAPKKFKSAKQPRLAEA